MALDERSLESAISFLASRPCELLYNRVFRIQVDLDRSTAQKRTELLLSVSNDLGFPPTLYRLCEPASVAMIEKAIAQDVDMSRSKSDEYLRELAFRFGCAWRNPTIRLSIGAEKSLSSCMDESSFGSVLSLNESEVQVVVECPEMSYESVLDDCLALSCLLGPEDLLRAWKIANDEAIPWRQWF